MWACLPECCGASKREGRMMLLGAALVGNKLMKVSQASTPRGEPSLWRDASRACARPLATGKTCYPRKTHRVQWHQLALLQKSRDAWRLTLTTPPPKNTIKEWKKKECKSHWRVLAYWRYFFKPNSDLLCCVSRKCTYVDKIECPVKDYSSSALIFFWKYLFKNKHYDVCVGGVF